MTTLNQIRNGDWASKNFWVLVDNLSWTQKCKIVKRVGGSDAVRYKRHNKERNAAKENLSLGLSSMDYAALLFQAGITAEQVCPRGYHLARLKDCGDYTRQNCRFILQQENHREKIITERARQAMRSNIKYAIEASLESRRQLKLNDPVAYRKRSKIGTTAMLEHRKRMRLENPDAYKLYESRRLFGKINGAKVRDAKTMKIKISLQRLRAINYPNRGWKTLLFETLLATAPPDLKMNFKYFKCFLARNPAYVERLL